MSQGSGPAEGLLIRYRSAEDEVTERVISEVVVENKCFRCGASERLELDHHVPQYYGGRLVPGNVVVLCFRCNAERARA